MNLLWFSLLLISIHLLFVTEFLACMFFAILSASLYLTYLGDTLFPEFSSRISNNSNRSEAPSNYYCC